jgi:hypothetical protein
MFLSNFLRLAFFIYKEFSLALLFQTVLNIIMQVNKKTTRSYSYIFVLKLWILKAIFRKVKAKLKCNLRVG